MSIGSTIHALWVSNLCGPLLFVPAFIWFCIALIFFVVACHDFKVERNIKNARPLRWSLVALPLFPLASPILAISALVYVIFNLKPVGKAIWENSFGLIWEALWMKENRNDLDAHSI